MLVLFIIISFNNLLSQEYFNRIIPFENENPNPIQFFKNSNENYIITSLNYYQGIGSSSLINYNWITNETNRINLKGYALTRKSFGIINKRFYLYGNCETGNQRSFLIRFNQDFVALDTSFYNTTLGKGGATTSTFFNKCIYGGNIDDFNNGAHREIGIKKIDTLGNEVWSRNYSQDNNLNYIWELDIAIDSNILMSSRVVYNGVYGGWPQLIKLDTAGNILWQNDSNEGIVDGSTPVWIAQLSDSNILQSYVIDKRNDPEFGMNNWNWHPIRLKWFDKNGTPTHEKLLTFPRLDNMYFNQIEAGKGDYFFAYGQYLHQIPNDYLNDYKYGILTKYNNAGDTIWTHKYQHPVFDTNNVSFEIKDIEELDNGDIVVMGDISKPGDRNKIWLFKVNEYGCYSADSCNEIVVGTKDFIDIGKEALRVNIYPNPASSEITVELPIDIKWKSWTIHDLKGRKVKSGSFNSGLKLQTSNIKVTDIQPSGVYLLRVKDDKGRVGIGKFVVE